jgi:protoporphyrin/coproporphyrin ferrochelatase
MTLPLPASLVRDEPAFQHGSRLRVGVLLVNLGTPDAADGPALRRYLKEFLSDPRVVEIPKLVWWPILNLIILNTRPKKSAAKYASVWLDEGSPLRVYSERQAEGLRHRLKAEGYDVEVELAMRYGNPSIGNAMRALQARKVNRLLVLPLYPQYSASTTATVFDKVYENLAAMRSPPALRTIRHYHDHPGYIQAVANRIRAHWDAHGRGDLLLFSFHGVPKRSLLKGDPYHCECHKTGRLVAQALGLADNEWKLSFQSRFGRAEWLKPYTSEVLEHLPQEGIKRLDVACPGFISDCLETLEEIAMEGKEEFLEAGGTEYRYIPCLNESPPAIDLLFRLVAEETQGWPVKGETDASRADRQVSRERALAIGAAD